MAQYIATAIKMRSGSQYSDSLLEIDEIYLDSASDKNWYKKEKIHDWLKENPKEIKVKTSVGPAVIPAVSKYGEKFVKSEPNNSTRDNLLELPRK